MGEYILERVRFIKNRVTLFCSLTFSLYFLSVFLWFLLYPEELSLIELIAGVFLIAGGMLVLAFNTKASTLFGVKLNAYIFTALLLILLAELGVIYEDSAEVTSAVFVFTLFLVSVTIPWKPVEVIFVAIMHLIAYSLTFFYLKQFHPLDIALFSSRHYIEGLMFISMAVLLCWVIRRHETERDIENFVLIRQISEKNDQMRKELEWATKVHKTIIPEAINNKNINIAVTYLPVYYIGGDYARYDFLDKERMMFFISDVTGHGVPAALLVNRIHAEFQRFSKEGKMPGALMKELNDFIKEDFEGANMYLTAFCGMVDFKKMVMWYSNWGHPPQYLFKAKENRIYPLPSQTCMLGLPLDDEQLYERQIRLNTADKILLYTDGITETVNSGGEEFGDKRLMSFFYGKHELPVKVINESLLKELNSFKYNNFKDDICLMTMEIKSHHGLFL